MNNHPAISVVMPVYNSEKYVAQAIESILNQNFSDFEFLIIDDCSADNSLQIIEYYKNSDSRIRLMTNETNLGNYPARQKAMKMARGKYICVMDSDDVAMPERLIKQFEFMEQNLDYVATGAFIHFLRPDGSTMPFTRALNEKECKVRLLGDNVCTHPTVIMRSETLLKHKIQYNLQYQYAADYDLMLQLTKKGKLGNMPLFLLQYRLHAKQISTSRYREQQKYADKIRLGQLAQLDIVPTPCESELHLKLMARKSITDNEISASEKWIDKILQQNKKKSILPQQQLEDFLKKEILAL